MRRSLLLFAAVALTATQAGAQDILRNDPKRPVEAISRDLGLTSAQFVACFYDVNPAPQGTRASGERERANKAILLPCLQRANPSITNESLDAVMDKYRPEGRVAG
ncbi:MAG TPA: hypothetical protein VHA70_02220 [Bauldia sp.]|nr:hypothetical protein [Bauldia sp.]